jgi:hypothetical protein
MSVTEVTVQKNMELRGRRKVWYITYSYNNNNNNTNKHAHAGKTE